MKKKNKKIIYCSGIIVLLIIIGIITIILCKNNMKKKDSKINELINLSAEKYIKEKFLNHDLLSIFTAATKENRNLDNIEIQYVLGYYMKQYEVNNVSEEQFLKTYKEIFGKEFELDVKLIDNYQPYYTYNDQDGKIYVKDIIEPKYREEYSYDILEINKEDDDYRLYMNLLNESGEKVATAILKLKIQDNDIIFVDYEEK